MGLGIAGEQYCPSLHISSKTLCKSTLWDSGISKLLKKHLNYLQIQGFAPLDYSQQYEGQQDTPDKVFYVEGGWYCNVLLRVEATQRDLQCQWTSVEDSVYPAFLVISIRQTSLPVIFQETSPLETTWKSHLQEIENLQ